MCVCVCMCVVQSTYRHIRDLGFATRLPYIGPPYTTGKWMYPAGIISNMQLNHVAREQLQILFPSNHCQLPIDIMFYGINEIFRCHINKYACLALF